MDFGYTPKVEELRERVRAFMDAHIVPRIRQWHDEVHAGQYPVSFMEELKARAKAEGLWNLFLPHLK
ncbi:acyl-CoA dehydrogenase, partial [Bacillus sp. AFS075960]